MAILSLFYVLIFSLIAHKEVRFMLPIIPFSALIGGYAFKKWAKAAIKMSKVQALLKFLVYIYILVEIVSGVIYFNLRKSWDVPAYLA